MTSALALEAPTVATPKAEDIGFDRELGLMLAKVPFTAIGWAALAWLASLAWAEWMPVNAESPFPNCGALAVICFGMVLAAWIDGYAFKVPNWLTLSLVVAGWYLGALHSLGYAPATGTGGIGQALLVTFLGFAALFPALFIGGMGQGDVKMTMAFGSWMGAFFGTADSNVFGFSGSIALFWSFAIGVIVGGIFGLLMMAFRRNFHKNIQNFHAIKMDLQALMTEGPAKCAERANGRRKDWVRLPYGVPLCVGFLAYLWLTVGMGVRF
jgi:prepilin peptidase CpaA